MLVIVALLTFLLMYLLMVVRNDKKTIRQQAEELQKIRLSDNFIDDITGTYNSKSIEHIIEERLQYARHKNRLVSFLLIDIDNFKRVNDAHGISRGDLVLKKLVTLFTGELRGDDRLIRYRMGDEFLVIATNTTGIDAAKALGNRLREKVAAFDWNTPPFQLNFAITISVGVTEYNMFSDAFINVLHQAEEALQHAKTYRNCVVLENEGTFIPFKLQ
ncbi:MAG: GGDEF domain-containing protein [Bacteroidetes bacterium]|nr:GGDEF domain-containing protein [Bacteroidota bacterium]